MPVALLPRDEVIERILLVFRQAGYEGASLARLSAATGLGRSSLYHYFPNGKEDMAAAAMAAVEAWIGEHVIAPLSAQAPPQKRLKQFSRGLAQYYENGKRACLMDVFTIGEAGARFQPHLRKRMKAMIAALARVAEEAGVAAPEAARRAENAVVSLQGSLVVARALGSSTPFLRMLDELPGLLLRA